MAVGKRWLVQRRAGELPRPRRVLVAFIQMNELLVPNEKITTPKGFPTTVPAAGEGFFLGMCPLVSLDMLDASEALATILARQRLGFLVAILPHLGNGECGGLVWRRQSDRAVHGLEREHYEQKRAGRQGMV